MGNKKRKYAPKSPPGTQVESLRKTKHESFEWFECGLHAVEQAKRKKGQMTKSGKPLHMRERGLTIFILKKKNIRIRLLRMRSQLWFAWNGNVPVLISSARIQMLGFRNILGNRWGKKICPKRGWNTRGWVEEAEDVNEKAGASGRCFRCLGSTHHRCGGIQYWYLYGPWAIYCKMDCNSNMNDSNHKKKGDKPEEYFEITTEKLQKKNTMTQRQTEKQAQS